MKIFCNNCNLETECVLVTGDKIYGSSFYVDKFFYRCSCGCYVGVQKANQNRNNRTNKYYYKVAVQLFGVKNG